MKFKVKKNFYILNGITNVLNYANGNNMSLENCILFLLRANTKFFKAAQWFCKQMLSFLEEI